MRSSFVLPLCLCATLFVSARAHAAPSEGEALFREGRAAMQEKDYERACVKFAESQRKEPAPGTALNLGDCEEQRGHLIAASEAFLIAASTFTTLDKQKYATARSEAADRRTPRLTIRASVAVPGLVVHVGANVMPIDTETKADPGAVSIRAEAPNHQAKVLKATLHEGKSLEIDIGSLDHDARDPVDPPVAVVPKAAEHGTDLRPIGLIVGGVGAASIVVGAVTGVLALGHASTVEAHCTADLACDAEGVDAASSGSTLSLVSTITIVTGSAALVGGALLYFLAPRKISATGRAALAPTASRDFAGFVLRGAF